jgi:hypothetical protein
MFSIKSQSYLDHVSLMGLSKMCSLKKSFTLLLLMLVSFSCSRIRFDPEADQSFLTDQPCSAPCWYGLSPGESTKAEVLETLKELPFVDDTSIKEYGTRWGKDDSAQDIRFGCRHPRERFCGSALISEDELKVLGLSANFPLDMEAVVNKLGPPDFIDYGGYHPEVGGCVVLLQWPDQGISASYLDTNNDRVCRSIKAKNGIPPDTQVESLSYSVPDAFDSKPAAGGLRIDWPGFSDK